MRVSACSLGCGGVPVTLARIPTHIPTRIPTSTTFALTPAAAQEYDASKRPPAAVNRTTQVFVNLNSSNWRLDKNLFVPFGVVVGEDGMRTFDSIFAGYGQEPDQVRDSWRDRALDAQSTKNSRTRCRT